MDDGMAETMEKMSVGKTVLLLVACPNHRGSDLKGLSCKLRGGEVDRARNIFDGRVTSCGGISLTRDLTPSSTRLGSANPTLCDSEHKILVIV